MSKEGARRKLLEHQKIWKSKKSLKFIYQDYFRTILEQTVEGDTLEIGGGFGGFKECCPSSVTTDVVHMSNLNVVCDGHALPFLPRSFNNVVAIDVLHHLERPIRFLREVVDVLHPYGRLIILEPNISPLARLLYLFHSETTDMTATPLIDGPLTREREPFDSNQAIGTLLTGRFREDLEQMIPGLVFRKKILKSLFAYPLSGGFQPWCLVASRAIRPLLSLEKRCLPILGSLMACRMIAVYEKRPAKHEVI